MSSDFGYVVLAKHGYSNRINAGMSFDFHPDDIRSALGYGNDSRRCQFVGSVESARVFSSPEEAQVALAELKLSQCDCGQEVTGEGIYKVDLVWTVSAALPRVRKTDDTRGIPSV